MELDWYSKKQFSSNSARRVATLTTFMGHVGSTSIMLVKPLYKRLSSSISSKSLPASLNSKKWGEDADDEFLDNFQPKCMSLGRSRKWVFSQSDERARRKKYNCFACVLHI